MKRSIEQAFLDLRQQVAVWASGVTKPEVRVFVYPPEWEARVLARFPAFAAECAADGCPVSLEDVGVGFLHDLNSSGLVTSLERLEQEDQDSLLHDLGI